MKLAKSMIRALLARQRRLVLGGVSALLLIAVAVVPFVRSWISLYVALLFLVVLLAGTLWDLRRTKTNVGWLTTRLEKVEAAHAILIAAAYAPPDGGSITDAVVPVEVRSDFLRGLIQRGDPLDAYAFATSTQSLRDLDLRTACRLRDALRTRGYLVRAADVAAVCCELEGTAANRRAKAMIDGDIKVFSQAFTPTIAAADPAFAAVPRRILHLVGNSLPETQSGYTLRTHYTAVAQRLAGLDPHVATQMGFAAEGGGAVEVDGVTYHRSPGPVRGAVPFDSWLEMHARGVADLVGKVRPALLHAASDFVNARTAEIVGRAYGIPVVYESRGFWEETWLSRQAQTFGWRDLARLESTYGLPDIYRWRRDIEDRSRTEADRVVTLAEVMADRIEEGGVARDRIAVIPNGVDVDAFPVLTRDLPLAATLGIDEGTTVIGYISSIVEYEGIDTLISAYATVKAASATPVALLIVGDGAELARLKAQAAALGLTDVIFTGRVAHDVVLTYYSLIDVFVVPRRPVEVCHLVTPLKPFEAFSTGRTVVLSNVRALAAIAAASSAAELFEAGDDASLAAVLLALVDDPQRRRELAAAGAEWVRAERTWAANADAYLRLYRQLGVGGSDGAPTIPRPRSGEPLRVAEV